MDRRVRGVTNSQTRLSKYVQHMKTNRSLWYLVSKEVL